MITVSEKTYSSVLELERATVEAASRDHLVLTSTSRLSRRLLHRFRLDRIRAGEQGWKTPTIVGFNRWAKTTYELLWEPFRPLSRLAALCLWKEATEGVKWLEGLRQGPSLFLELQDSFDALMRSGQPLAGPPSGHPLADWRREVFGLFLKLLERDRYLPWSAVLESVGKAVDEKKVNLPREIIFAGFNELSPIEERLVNSLANRVDVSLHHASKTPEEPVRVQVYATPEQESQSVCTEVLQAWNSGQKRLGVVFLDQDYFKVIRQSLEELTDREERSPDALRYNLTQGTPLQDHPLFQTAVLPLRVPDETQPNGPLSSLLFSPYVRRFEEDRDLSVRSVLWVRGGGEPLKDRLDLLIRAGCPIGPLRTLSLYRTKPLWTWLQELETLWKNLEFPVCRCETDTLAKEHLFSLLDDLKKEVGNQEMSRNDVVSWVTAVSRGIEVVEKTPETAGIQILNLAESRGMAFDRLWVVGTHGRVLPQAVGELPFLDPDELRNVEGGTVEGQWEKGLRNLASLLSSAPVVTFTRAASRGEESPYLPCPLIPERGGEEIRRNTVDLWREPPREWLRARWLREGLQGVPNGIKVREESGLEPINIFHRGELRVTELEDLLLCPFRFFARHLLGLEPLEEPEVGIDPRERGRVIHKILREFALGLTEAVPDWPNDKNRAFAFLEETVDRILSDKQDDFFWKVERLRLLGSDPFPGLLEAWLEVEQKRALEGWRFERAEESFEGCLIEKTGITLKGRFDRIDHHPEKGKALWDYKTGEPPPRREVIDLMVRPQLPAYLLALKKGLLSHTDAWEGEIEAGYIVLRRASEIELRGLKKVEWLSFLNDWTAWVQERLAGPLNGIYLTDPRPRPSWPQFTGACTHCPFPNLCGIGDREMDGEDDSDPGGE